MWRRWFLLGFLAPVLTFASTGCFVGGAEVFIADATVKPLVAIATTSPVVFIRFKYDVRDGRRRMKGHYRDPGGIALGSPNAKPGVFIKFQGVLPPVDPTAGVAPIGCMGARVEYIAEDPDHPHRGDIIDMNGLPLFANEGELEIDACDNNHDKDMSVGDQLDMGVLSGPYTGYGIDGVVVDGKFECKSPDIACEQDL